MKFEIKVLSLLSVGALAACSGSSPVDNGFGSSGSSSDSHTIVEEVGISSFDLKLSGAAEAEIKGSGGRCYLRGLKDRTQTFADREYYESSNSETGNDQNWAFDLRFSDDEGGIEYSEFEYGERSYVHFGRGSVTNLPDLGGVDLNEVEFGDLIVSGTIRCK